MFLFSVAPHVSGRALVTPGVAQLALCCAALGCGGPGSAAEQVDAVEQEAKIRLRRSQILTERDGWVAPLGDYRVEFSLDDGDQVFLDATTAVRNITRKKHMVAQSLRCAKGDTATGGHEVSGATQNIWSGLMSFTIANRGIFTAAAGPGTYTCYVAALIGKRPESGVEWLAGGKSRFRYYRPNTYRGATFAPATSDCERLGGKHCKDPHGKGWDRWIHIGPGMPFGKRTTVIVETWHAPAEIDTAKELVMMFDPHVTTCSDQGVQCADYAWGDDRSGTRLRARIKLRQYKDGQLCQRTTFAWTPTYHCEKDTHHCQYYFREVQKIPRSGPCGKASGARTFRVFGELEWQDGNAMRVKGRGNRKTTLTIYARN